jgi:uncharacterized delta-60 repeat protein
MCPKFRRFSGRRSGRSIGFLGVECLEDRTLLSPGGLDPSFGNGGKVLTDFASPLDASATAAALQGDGKVVVAGMAKNAAISQDFAVLRYTPSGSLDPTFGTNGQVVTDFNGRSDRAQGVAIQADGRIVVVGTSFANGQGDFALARYNSDGTLDSTFGTGGELLTDFGISDAEADAVAIQADGSIDVAGFSGPGKGGSGNDSITLARFQSNGTLDSAFGTGGAVVMQIAGRSSQATSLALEGDGKIVVAGNLANGIYFDIGLARFNSDGTLDTTFGNSGTVDSTFVSFGITQYAFAYGVAIQADGKIDIAGGVSFGFSVLRYTAAGVLDPTFGSGGVSTLGSGQANALAIQPDGKILAGGGSGSSSDTNTDFTLDRFNADGTPDASFGTSGMSLTDLGGGDVASALLLQSNSDIVLAGTSTQIVQAPSINFRGDVGLARYAPAGGLDSSFGAGGKIITTLLGSTDSPAASVAIQQDGKLIAAGTTGLTGFRDFAVARYNTDGSLDTTFGNGGRVTCSFGGDDTAADVVVQPDGKILVAGSSDQETGIELAVVRLLADGSLDPTFGTAGEVTIASARASAAALLGNGQILLAGSTLVRLNTDGSLDTSFGSGGKVALDLAASSLTIEPDGRIAVAGGVLSVTGRGFVTITDLGVERFNPDGSADTTFGTGGKVVTRFSFESLLGAGGATFAVAAQTDGRLLAAAFPLDGATGTPGIVRYNANGALDVTFGTSGRVNTDFVSGSAAAAHRIAIQNNGLIVVVGSGSGVGNDFLVECYNQDGTLDKAFGSGGKVLTNFQGKADDAVGVLVQPDGNLVVAGSAQTNSGSAEFALARYLGDTTPIVYPNTLFVKQVYLDLLQRPVDNVGLVNWLTQLFLGYSRENVAYDIERSQEYRTLVVEGMYHAYLGRQADTAGLNTFVSFLGNGGTDEAVKAMILGSPEYFARAGSTNAAFLTAVYRDVLGRAVDPTGQQNWTNALNNGASRSAVAAAIVTSTETYQDVVESFYHQFLRRAADPFGLNLFVGALEQEVMDEMVIAKIVGSPEYFMRF